MRTHTGQKPYQCTQCDYASKYSRNLKIHSMQHTGEKPHQCTQCDYASTQPVNLKIHLMKHTGEKPHQCMKCKYSSTRAEHLTRHMRTHIEEKHITVPEENTTYSCSNCNEVFIKCLSLTNHVVNCKAKAKCKFCDFSCERVSSLNMHLLTHLYE